MTDLLHEAAAWLDSMRAAHLSQTVRYWRGEQSVELPATPGTTEYELADETGVTVRAVAADFIVAAADLRALDPAAPDPRPGDRIALADGRTFEVMDLAGAGHFRPCDSARTMLRIHAKLIA